MCSSLQSRKSFSIPLNARGCTRRNPRICLCPANIGVESQDWGGLCGARTVEDLSIDCRLDPRQSSVRRLVRRRNGHTIFLSTAACAGMSDELSADSLNNSVIGDKVTIENNRNNLHEKAMYKQRIKLVWVRETFF